MDEYRNNLMCYQATMAVVQSMLNQGIIDQGEYRKIDTIMTKRYGVSLDTIFAQNIPN